MTVRTPERVWLTPTSLRELAGIMRDNARKRLRLVHGKKVQEVNTALVP